MLSWDKTARQAPRMHVTKILARNAKLIQRSPDYAEGWVHEADEVLEHLRNLYRQAKKQGDREGMEIIEDDGLFAKDLKAQVMGHSFGM